MTASSRRLGETIVVASLARPEADAVFLSNRFSRCTPGELNQYVIKHFGLGEKDLPTTNDLTDGYFITPAGRSLLCYVVTIDGRPPARLLELQFREMCTRQPVAIAAHILGTADGDRDCAVIPGRELQDYA